MINLTHDGTIDIATGKSRKETNWRNREILLSALYTKLSEAYRTYETYKEYLAMKPDKQAELKDRGGFVGGMLSQGRRKASSVVTRQLLTLDLDFANKDFWNDFTLLYSNSACIYSTHKHSPEKPRLRLVMPLDRAVTPEEYVAIGRRIAGMIGIEQTDPTSFEPSRLMYWPSSSKDGEWVFELQDGEWLNADAVLATYKDWRDSSEWPMASGEGPIKEKHGKPLEDPREKQGWIGVFCRMFDLHQAIERFLPDVYTPGEPNDRYTFNGGSTANGLIVYDEGLRSWSNHSTDPTHGRVCNAFDLVRIHKFGHLDDKIKEHTPVTKIPSFLAMENLCAATKDIVRYRNVEAFGGVPEEAEEETEEETPDSKDWLGDLDVDRKGNPYTTVDNILLILVNDVHLKGKIGFDDFEKCEVALKHLPWRKISRATRRLNDIDDACIQHYLEKTYKISNTSKYRQAMQVLNNRTCFHPVKDYLNKQVWDKVPRIDNLLIDYLGAADSEYTKAVTRKTLAASVARIMQPGAKFDFILTLVGREGVYKSTLIAALGQEWFSDSFSLHMIGSKESFEQLQGVMILEIAELAGMARKEVESIKSFFSKRVDRYRVAFGHKTEDFPRQCVPWATTNKWDFLKEANGNRRFWPVSIYVTEPTKNVVKDFTKYEIDQVWAEAVEVYRKGEKLYLSEGLLEAAMEVQKAHTEVHPWHDKISDYLNIPLPKNWNRMTLSDRQEYVKSGEVSAFGGSVKFSDLKPRVRVCVQAIWEELFESPHLIDERTSNAIRSIMRQMNGWEEDQLPAKYGPYGVQRRGYFLQGDIEEYAETPDLHLN